MPTFRSLLAFLRFTSLFTCLPLRNVRKQDYFNEATVVEMLKIQVTFSALYLKRILKPCEILEMP